MADRDMPDTGTLRKILDYDPETGFLSWKPRDTDMFKSSGLFDKEAVAKAWNSRFAGARAFPVASNGYAQGSIFGFHHKGQRVAWTIFYGRHPDGFIDHINGIRSDNRIRNLRVVDARGNAMNAKVHPGSSGHVGVTWCPIRKRWLAHINSMPHKRIRLGRFMTKEQAIKARRDAEVKYGYHPNHGRG